MKPTTKRLEEIAFHASENETEKEIMAGEILDARKLLKRLGDELARHGGRSEIGLIRIMLGDSYENNHGRRKNESDTKYEH